MSFVELYIQHFTALKYSSYLSIFFSITFIITGLNFFFPKSVMLHQLQTFEERFII